MQHQAVDVEHLLLALVEQNRRDFLPVLQKVGAAPDRLLRRSGRNWENSEGLRTSQIYMTPRLNEVFKRAQDEAGG